MTHFSYPGSPWMKTAEVGNSRGLKKYFSLDVPHSWKSPLLIFVTAMFLSPYPWDRILDDNNRKYYNSSETKRKRTRSMLKTPGEKHKGFVLKLQLDIHTMVWHQIGPDGLHFLSSSFILVWSQKPLKIILTQTVSALYHVVQKETAQQGWIPGEKGQRTGAFSYFCVLQKSTGLSPKSWKIRASTLHPLLGHVNAVQIWGALGKAN